MCSYRSVHTFYQRAAAKGQGDVMPTVVAIDPKAPIV